MTGNPHATPNPLDAGRRETLAKLADELVPAALGMPAATEVDVHLEGINHVLAARPDLGQPLADLLDKVAGEEPAAALQRLNDEDPEAIAVLGTAVTGAYYIDPRVRDLLGYHGQPNQPVAPGESDEYLSGGLLDQVRERGPVFRPTPS
jgi:hypothetical protein